MCGGFFWAGEYDSHLKWKLRSSEIFNDGRKRWLSVQRTQSIMSTPSQLYSVRQNLSSRLGFGLITDPFRLSLIDLSTHSFGERKCGGQMVLRKTEATTRNRQPIGQHKPWRSLRRLVAP